MRTRTSQRGFTLVEMLVVIAIIALLAALLFPTFGRARENARQKSCMVNMKAIGQAVSQYHLDNKRYPRTLTDLQKHLDISIDGSVLPCGALAAGRDKLLCRDDLRDIPDRALASTYGGFGAKPSVAEAPMGPNPPDCTNTNPGFYAINHPENCPDFGTQSPCFGNYDPINLYQTSAGPDSLQLHWNYWGYNEFGRAVRRASSPFYLYTCAVRGAGCTAPAGPPRGISGWSNYPALANKNAPDNTIITHCWFHRPITGAYDPNASAWDNSSMEIVLRVGGDAKAIKTTEMDKLIDPAQTFNAFTNPNKWIYQGD